MKLSPYDYQLSIEERYSKKKIKKLIVKEIEETKELQRMIASSVKLLNNWMDKDFWESKNDRINQLRQLDLEEFVTNILTVTLQIQQPQTLTSVVGQLAPSTGLANNIDAIKTIAEVLAVLVDVGFYDIFKESKYDQLKLRSCFMLSDELRKFIEQTKYLPPMVCVPKQVKYNYDNAYLKGTDPLILKSHNYHNFDICIDHINRVNQIPLSLDISLLKLYNELPTKSSILEDPEKKEAFDKMVHESYQTYAELIHAGNHFYLTHRVDKRGRTYAQGYHVNTQGTSFKKAIIDFHEKEVIEGVPCPTKS